MNALAPIRILSGFRMGDTTYRVIIWRHDGYWYGIARPGEITGGPAERATDVIALLRNQLLAPASADGNSQSD